MRTFATALLAACTLSGCGWAVAGGHPSSGQLCEPNFSDGIYVDVQLGESDNGRAMSVPLCSVIELALGQGWGPTQVSDTTVITTLQKPSMMGFRPWLLAGRTGSATVSATRSGATWRVAITVVQAAVPTPAPTPQTCQSALGNVITVDRRITEADNGRSLTVPLCGVVSVFLHGSASDPWRDMQPSSGILELIPLPLPFPGQGSIDLWFRAKRTGSVSMTATSPGADWRVAVTVVPAP